jgi:hypothetical protein
MSASHRRFKQGSIEILNRSNATNSTNAGTAMSMLKDTNKL